MKNKLVVIGWLGDKVAYLNVPAQEALERYLADFGTQLDSQYVDTTTLPIKEIEFDDAFGVYDAYKE